MIVVVLFYVGFSMHLDVQRLYNIQHIDECKAKLEWLVAINGAKDGFCHDQDIETRFGGA